MSHGAACPAACPERAGLVFGEGPFGLGIGVVKGEIGKSSKEGSGDEGSKDEG